MSIALPQGCGVLKQLCPEPPGRGRDGEAGTPLSEDQQH